MSACKTTVLRIISEGKTEGIFVRDTLQSHFSNLNHNLVTTPILITTKRKHNRIFRGGVTCYTQVRKEIERTIKQAQLHGDIITTMIDLYALPDDFPGYRDSLNKQLYDRVEYLECELKKDLGSTFDDLRRFIPYIQVHEFESLVLVNPDNLSWYFTDHDKQINELKSEIAGLEPEMIDDGFETAPSKRISRHLTGFESNKTTVSPVAASKTGIPLLRKNCPHFNKWINTLEGLITCA